MGTGTAVLEKSAANNKRSNGSLKQRLLVAAILIPLIGGFLIWGGIPFYIFFCFALSLAGWEFWRMFRTGGYAPSLCVIIVFIVGIFVLRALSLENYIGMWLSALILLALADAVRQQSQNIPNATLNFAFTITGVMYVGWLGSYLPLLRNLSQGLFWTLLIIFAAAMADTGGYFFGSLFGRHLIAPSISPKKTWEGYLGGILFGGLSTLLAALVLHHFIPEISILVGTILGVTISALVPIGDFAESMFKRQFQIKDSSHILPGHGGVLDRIDTSLWAIVIGYYLIIVLI
jgi:phosphatidate cytidylyltransferase